MNNKENAGGFLCTDEERLLISRATELSERSEKDAVALSFLTPREQRLVFLQMEREGKRDRVFFWGGYFGSERRLAIFLPSWIEGEEPCRDLLYSEERERYFADVITSCGMDYLLSEFTAAVRLSPSGYAGTLSHRDYLGALMALGLRRSAVGDICVLSDCAVVLCEKRIAAFIADELKKAGRDTIRCQLWDIDESFSAARRFDNIATTVASARLDGVVRALCNVSRDEAVDLVEKGMVEVNYFVEKEPDRRIAEGDILSVRGFGKYIIDGASDVTRRQRIRLLARKYV